MWAAMRLAGLIALCSAISALADVGDAEAPKSALVLLTEEGMRRRLKELRVASTMSPDMQRALDRVRAHSAPGGQLHRLNTALERLREDSSKPNGRRLWTWPESTVGPNEIQVSADAWKESTSDGGGFAQNGATGADAIFANLKAAYQGIEGNLREIRTVSESSWEATTGFATYLESTYFKFSVRVKPFFESPYGVVPILSSSALMLELIKHVEAILDATDQVFEIGEASNIVSMSVDTIVKHFSKGLVQLKDAERRRLLAQPETVDFDRGAYQSSFDYDSLMSGLDFNATGMAIEHANKNAAFLMQKLQTISDGLKPILRLLGQAGPAPGDADEANTTIVVEEDQQAVTQVTERALRGEQVSDEVQARAAEASRRLRAIQQRLRQEMLSDLGIGRRLQEKVPDNWGEIMKDKAKYEDYMMDFIPTWRKSETLTKDTCQTVKTIAIDVESLACRFHNFFSEDTIPGGEVAVMLIVKKCDAAARELISGEGDCPLEVQSNKIHDAFSAAAGVVSLIFAILEFIVMQNRPLGILIGLIVLFTGSIFAFLGYFLNNIEFLQGFCGGSMFFVMIFSLLIAWFDVCKGGSLFPDCNSYVIIGSVLTLSCGCGVLFKVVDEFERVEKFISAFTTGAFVAGLFYLVLFRDDIFGGMLDTEGAKPYMMALSVVMFLIGLCLSAVSMTFDIFRQLQMMSMSILGACFMVLGVICVVPHWWGIGDFIMWILFSFLGYIVQVFITPPDFEMAEVLNDDDDEEEKNKPRKTPKQIKAEIEDKRKQRAARTASSGYGVVAPTR
jgi:hypothetical protein